MASLAPDAGPDALFHELDKGGFGDEARAARLQVKRDRDAAKVLEKDAGIAAKL